ncbi:MAG: hypothetical protein Q8N51_15720 [Gammaproteobacteria bacterium]|nr:hypothetical protein [Gammaproteobacteria bacterium]
MTILRGKDFHIVLAYLIEGASFFVGVIFETAPTISIAITFILAGYIGFVATRIGGSSTRSGALTGGSIVFVGAILGFLWSALGGGASGVKPEDALAGYAGMFLVTILYFCAAAIVALVFALLGNRIKNTRLPS